MSGRRGSGVASTAVYTELTYCPGDNNNNNNTAKTMLFSLNLLKTKKKKKAKKQTNKHPDRENRAKVIIFSFHFKGKDAN